MEPWHHTSQVHGEKGGFSEPSLLGGVSNLEGKTTQAFPPKNHSGGEIWSLSSELGNLVFRVDAVSGERLHVVEFQFCHFINVSS